MAKLALMFQMKHESCADGREDRDDLGDSPVRVSFAVGEKDEHTQAYALADAGALTMTADQWKALAAIIAKGVKRPHVVTFI